MTALIEQICQRVRHGADATADDRAAALRAFEDTLAVILAGWSEPVSEAAKAYGAGGAAPLVTGEGAASAEHAAFIHAVAGHALDYDDVHLVSTTHPSVVIVPALMALATDRQAGPAMTDAYGVGVSVNVALGRALGLEHYARGWHATSTIGPLAAAAAGCHLLGLGEPATRNALALAAAQAGGLQRNFGAMAKPVQAGNAAAAGVRAVLLAAAGVSGDGDIFGEKGFIDLYGGESLEARPLLAGDVHSISVKLYPCCYATHRIIAAALAVRADPDFDLARARRIVLRAPPETLRPLRVTDPQTGNEAKFCASYAVAVALLRGDVDLTDFTNAAVGRPEVRALMDRVEIEETPLAGRPPGGLDSGDIELRLDDGHVFAGATCAHCPGSPEAPPTAAQFEAKIDDCIAAYAGADGRRFSREAFRAKLSEITGQPEPRGAA